ncbi:T9SS type A sorting domain-containing protein, partial [bacterium]|nr:T9SS type A sorting domain-containing protein [bacterium]
HGPDEVWCFEGAGGDSSWPAVPGNPWRSWSKFAPPIPQPSKWFLTAEHTQSGSGLAAWCGCDLPGVNAGCAETVFWANPANLDGYGDDWNYPLILNVDGGDRAAGATLTFDIRYDAECNYDYVYLEFLSSFQAVGPDTVFTWTELARYNGVSGVFGATVCGGDALGHAAADSSGTPQYGNASWVGGVNVPLPTTGGTSATNTRLRWRAVTDGAWSDADDRADTQGLVLLDNVNVAFTAGGTASDSFDGGTPGNAFTTPAVGGAVTDAEWTPEGLTGNPYNPWRVAFDPDYKNQGNTCDFSADWMFTTRLPILNTYTNEAAWDYYLVTPSIPCTGWTGGVIQLANYRCIVEANPNGEPRNDFSHLLHRVHDGASGTWSTWNDFDEGVLFFGGCEGWAMNERHDLTPFLGGTVDSFQVGFEMLDLSNPGDFTWGKHRNTSWQIDRVAIGSFDGSATVFQTSSIRLFADTFSLTDPAHTAQMDNPEQGIWSGQTGGTRVLEMEDSLSVDIHDPDGLSTGPVTLHWRVGTGTPPTYGAWNAKAMLLRQQDILGTPGEGMYTSTIGNTADEDYDATPPGEGTPDHVWAAGTTVQYYVAAVDDAANVATFPTRAGVDTTDVFRFQVLPFARVLTEVDSARVLIVDDYDREDLDFENSTGFVANGGAGYGAFTNPAFDEPENMVERALILLAGGDQDDAVPPVDGGPKWDVYNVLGAGSSVQCEPRIVADPARGLGGLVTPAGDPLYDAVIWLHGTVAWSAYSDSSAVRLPDYLAAGGNLLSFGSDVVESATGAGGTLIADYLGTTYAGAEVEWRVCSITGESGSSLDGNKFGLYGECNGIRKTYDQLELAPLVPVTNSVLAHYSDSNNPGVPVTEAPALIRNVVNGAGIGIQAGFDVGSMLSAQSRACFLGSILADEFGLTGVNDACWVTVPGVPDPAAGSIAFTLSPAAPTPFRSDTSFRFSMPVRAPVSITVYDILGRKVRSLVNEPREAGSYTESWDGRADSGAPASSGIYFVKMTAGEFTATRKAVLLR